MSVTLNGTQVTGGGAALDLESVPTIINKNAQYNVTKTVGPLKITLKQRGIFSILELRITTANNNGIIVNALEVIRAIEELGIHTKKGGNPFWFILNFKGINYISYGEAGFGYIPPEFNLVEKNYISQISGSDSIDAFFGIGFDKIPFVPVTIYRIIGYWTDDEYL